VLGEVVPAGRRDGLAVEVLQAGAARRGDRLGDLLAERLHVELGAGLVHPAAGFADLVLQGRQLGGTKEEAVEYEVEDRPVLGRLGQGRGEGGPERPGLPPVDLRQRA